MTDVLIVDPPVPCSICRHCRSDMKASTRGGVSVEGALISSIVFDAGQLAMLTSQDFADRLLGRYSVRIR